MIFEYDATVEAFRDAVLKALDKTAQDLFNEKLGADDVDLPRLFRAVDEHVRILAARYHITLVEKVI